MVWLWLFFPAVVLAVAIGLWRATVHLRAERDALGADQDRLRDAAQARPPATGREQVRR